MTLKTDSSSFEHALTSNAVAMIAVEMLRMLPLYGPGSERCNARARRASAIPRRCRVDTVGAIVRAPVGSVQRRRT
jgi:hypothetical protein